MQRHLRDWLGFWLSLYQRFMENRGAGNAAALTYTTLFAVVPMMTVTFAMLSAIPAFQGVGEEIQAFIFRAPADLVRRRAAGGDGLSHAGDHREDLQRDLARASAASRDVQLPALLGDPQPGPLAAWRGVRGKHLYRLAGADFRAGCRAGSQDPAGLRAAAVQYRGLHPALRSGTQHTRSLAPCTARRAVRRDSVRGRQGTVRPLCPPVPRLPPDLRGVRHRAAVSGVDLPVLADRAVGCRAGVRPVAASPLAA
ncbi:UNVERIFIED_CONTAM: UPF0761 membrane protein [Trichonephila clavipes]